MPDLTSANQQGQVGGSTFLVKYILLAPQDLREKRARAEALSLRIGPVTHG
jgi:hypothetical protein